jgi:hypothetical protein
MADPEIGIESGDLTEQVGHQRYEPNPFFREKRITNHAQYGHIVEEQIRSGFNALAE